MLNKLFLLIFFLFMCGLAAGIAGFRQLSGYIVWISVPVVLLGVILNFREIWRKNKEIFGLDEKEDASATKNEQIKIDTQSKP